MRQDRPLPRAPPGHEASFLGGCRFGPAQGQGQAILVAHAEREEPSQLHQGSIYQKLYIDLAAMGEDAPAAPKDDLKGRAESGAIHTHLDSQQRT